jgi:hypothetical protein
MPGAAIAAAGPRRQACPQILAQTEPKAGPSRGPPSEGGGVPTTWNPYTPVERIVTGGYHDRKDASSVSGVSLSQAHTCIIITQQIQRMSSIVSNPRNRPEIIRLRTPPASRTAAGWGREERRPGRVPGTTEQAETAGPARHPLKEVGSAGAMRTRRPVADRMALAGCVRHLAGRMLPARGPDRDFFGEGGWWRSRADVRPGASSTRSRSVRGGPGWAAAIGVDALRVYRR